MKENARQSECGLRCKYCGYDTHNDVINAAFWMDNRLIVVESVPARLCMGCGEQFFEEYVTQSIQKFFKDPIVKPERQIRVFVYDFPQLKSIGKYRQFQSIRANNDSQASLQCKHCKSETVEKMVRSAFWVNEQLIAVENIPARVCQECEVHFYDDETAEKIAALDKIRTVPDGATRDVAVSVFSLANTGSAADKRYHQDKAGGLCE